MRLEDLYENFGMASPEMQELFIASYRERRAIDMEKPAKSFRKKSSSQSKKVQLTEKEKVVAKLLGLRQKDIIALRQSVEDEELDDSDNAILLNDNESLEYEE